MTTNEILLDEGLVEQSDAPNEHNIASQSQRFFTYLIDLIAFYIVIFILAMLLTLDGDPGEEAVNLVTIAFYVLYFCYYLLGEGIWGVTLGKLIMRTKVVTNKGEKINLKHSFIRTISRLVPFEFFSVFGENTVMWHDSWASTRVVKSNI